MRKLKPNASFEDVQKYIEMFQKKTSNVMKRDSSCSWLRGPYYDIEEEALIMSKSLTNSYARCVLVMGVIEDIAACGMCCNTDFCWDGYTIFHYFRDALCALAREIQEGTRTFCDGSMDSFINDLHTCIRTNPYVTSGSDTNFCCQDLGDWEGLINMFKVECSRKLSQHELASREVEKTAKIVTAVEEDLAKKVNEEAIALKKYEAAKKKTAAATRKAAKVKKQHEECVQKKESLGPPPPAETGKQASSSLSNFGPPAERQRLGFGRKRGRNSGSGSTDIRNLINSAVKDEKERLNKKQRP